MNEKQKPEIFIVSTDKYSVNKDKIYKYLDEQGYPETLSDHMYASAIADTLERDFGVSCETIASIKPSLGKTAIMAPSHVISALREYARYDLRASNFIHFLSNNVRLRKGTARVQVVPSCSNVKIIVK